MVQWKARLATATPSGQLYSEAKVNIKCFELTQTCRSCWHQHDGECTARKSREKNRKTRRHPKIEKFCTEFYVGSSSSAIELWVQCKSLSAEKTVLCDAVTSETEKRNKSMSFLLCVAHISFVASKHLGVTLNRITIGVDQIRIG